MSQRCGHGMVFTACNKCLKRGCNVSKLTTCVKCNAYVCCGYERCEICNGVMCAKCVKLCDNKQYSHFHCGSILCAKICTECNRLVCNTCIMKCYDAHEQLPICYTCCEYTCRCGLETCGCLKCSTCNSAICCYSSCSKKCARCTIILCIVCKKSHKKCMSIAVAHFINILPRQIVLDIDELL